jgi:hypothetical protein
MQPSGDAVLLTPSGTVVWETGTTGNPGAHLSVTKAGDLKVFSPTGTQLFPALSPPPPPPPPPPSGLAKNIVAIANGQDQNAAKVAETPDGSNCNPYTAFFTRGNVNSDLGGSCPTINGVHMRAESWCSDFAQWVWLNAGAQTDGITGWSFTFVDYGIRHGTFKKGATNNPQPGDAVVFGDYGSRYGSHVGIVTAVKNGKIQMTSGNWGNAVIITPFFDPTSDPGAGYPIIGYISPVAIGTAKATSLHASVTTRSVSQAQINSQDHGR